MEWKQNHPVKEVSFCIRQAKHYYMQFYILKWLSVQYLM